MNSLLLLLCRCLGGLGLLTDGVGERTDATEAYVRTWLVLELAGAPCGADVALGVFPRAAAHALLLQTIGVFHCGMILQLRVEVAHGINTSLCEDGRCPLGHIAGHVEEAVGVGLVDAHLRGDEVPSLV